MGEGKDALADEDFDANASIDVCASTSPMMRMMSFSSPRRGAFAECVSTEARDGDGVVYIGGVLGAGERRTRERERDDGREGRECDGEEDDGTTADEGVFWFTHAQDE